MLGVVAASIWLIAAILGFQQFGLPTVLFGLALAYSGAALYAWRVIEDRLRRRPSRHCPDAPRQAHRRHAAGARSRRHRLLLAPSTPCRRSTSELVSVLEDIFVAVALLTISVGLVLPGMITYSATEVSKAAKRLTTGTLQRVLARDGGARARRSRRCARLGQHRAGQTQFARRARRDGGKLQRAAGGGAEGGHQPRRGAREDAGRARRAPGTPRGDRLSRPSRRSDQPANRPALSLQLARTLDQRRSPATASPC